MIEKAIEKINEQIGRSNDGNVRNCGYQLIDIIKTTPGAAELVLQDFETGSMNINDCEKKIHEEWKKNRGIDSKLADKVIREFYGLPAAEERPAPAPAAKKRSHIDLGEFFK